MKKNALVVGGCYAFNMLWYAGTKGCTSSTGGVEQTTMKMLGGQGRAADDRGPVSADINDSDEFFQNAIKAGTGA